jgi:hypothetical protein
MHAYVCVCVCVCVSEKHILAYKHALAGTHA